MQTMKCRSLSLRRICLPIAIVLPNPLDSIREDRIVKRWADDKGKLALIIERGPGDSYNSWSPEDYYAHRQIYVAATGGFLFTESPATCDGHKFQTPSSEESPRGCWGADSHRHFRHDSRLPPAR